MRNYFIIGLIVIVSIVGIYTIIDYNSQDDLVIENGDIELDEISKKYNINNEYFVISTGDEVLRKIDNDETFVVFVGRETWPFCQKTLPELHDAVGNSDIDTVYYVHSRESENGDYLDEINHFSDPHIVFYKNGEVHLEQLGFEDESFFLTILNQLK